MHRPNQIINFLYIPQVPIEGKLSHKMKINWEAGLLFSSPKNGECEIESGMIEITIIKTLLSYVRNYVTIAI